ncbi:MAG: methyltransferase domain-containing protein [Verrucomicrobia bacterium]|nr:methyltransferase domain-containing protein [Verrucomicrobiota bacterium]
MGCQPWRDYCDAIHRLLLARWAGGSRFRRSLKTDLFDESVGNGCLNALESISDEVHGIDISPKVVESAGARNPQSKTLVGDVRNMPYDDASFGFVFSNSTIDHFATRAEIEQSIGEMARVLANQGVLILTLDNPRNPMVGLRNFLPQRPLEASGLVPYFMGVTLPMRELVAVLGGAGFRVLKQRYLMHAPRVVFLHLLRALQKLPAVSGAVLQAMLAMEAAAGFPTAGITGHFSAVLAAKE